jgi:hypothetical protein
MLDMQFAKTIKRIQQNIIMELNKIAMTHLIAVGFDEEDAVNFRITMNEPSSQREIIDNEMMAARADLFNKLTENTNGIPIMSHTKAKQIVFQMTEDEIKRDIKQIGKEALMIKELDDYIESDGTAGTSSGAFPSGMSTVASSSEDGIDGEMGDNLMDIEGEGEGDEGNPEMEEDILPED